MRMGDLYRELRRNNFTDMDDVVVKVDGVEFYIKEVRREPQRVVIVLGDKA